MQREKNSIAAQTALAARVAVIIANPASHRFARGIEELRETVQFLQQHGWQAELRLTQAADDARRFTREAVEQKATIEPIGHTPATFTIAPAVLNVIVPQESPEGLFSHPPIAQMRTQDAGV